MKFWKILNLNITLLVNLVILTHYTLCNENQAKDNSYASLHLSQLVFGENKPIADLELINRIHANVLYETWEVVRQEHDAKRPYYAHIFKYTLGDKFPLQNSDLKLFCLRINDYNLEMKKKNLMIRSLPCHDYLIHNKTINNGVVSYVLMQKPRPGEPLTELCKQDTDLIRVCRYQLKDFVKGFINSIIYGVDSKQHFDVYFPINKNALFYGRKSHVRGDVNATNSNIREIFLMDKQKKSNYKELQSEDDVFYLMIPFFKFFSPETIENQSQILDDSLKAIQNKQTMVYLGKLLIEMYKGLNKDKDNGFNPQDGSFNPNLVRFANNTDLFLTLHRNEQTKTLQKLFVDEYLGFSNDFISKLQAFLEGNYNNQVKVKLMDEDLNRSFAGFVSKLVNFDDKNERQFDSFQNALNHPFLISQAKDKLIRSDTSYEF